MNISITFRHMDSTEALKAYATDKVAKLQKFLRQPMTAKVTLSLEKLEHVVEVQISSGGAHLEAKEASEDTYVSLDRVMAKLERQVREHKNMEQSRSRRGESLRNGRHLEEEPPAPEASGTEASAAEPLAAAENR